LPSESKKSISTDAESRQTMQSSANFNEIAMEMIWVVMGKL